MGADAPIPPVMIHAAAPDGAPPAADQMRENNTLPGEGPARSPNDSEHGEEEEES